ncbi:MAG: 8-amino-7-oxononanoate synthase [Polyangiaceae bacterium]
MSSSPSDPFRALRHLQDDLGDLESAGLLRLPGARSGAASATFQGATNFCSNDYLGLASEVADVEAVEGGSGASRLISGDHAEHVALERELATWLGAPAALTFSSGYAANVGALGCLLRPEDLVVSDRLNHASLIDGIRLAKARPTVVDHLDLDATERALRAPRPGRAWVVTESYFSMDGDGPNLRVLRNLCDRYDAALYVDEAHAVGVFGPAGRGLCAEAEVRADVSVVTFGKSLGTAGAAVVGPESLRLWLWNRARSFVFTTGPSPLVLRHTRRNLARVRAAEELRERLASNAHLLRCGLRELGFEPGGFGPIVPVVLGDPAVAVRVSRALVERGFLVSAIRPPTVPVGSARLRFTVTARHSEAEIRGLLAALASVLGASTP